MFMVIPETSLPENINPLLRNVVKWSNKLLKNLAVNALMIFKVCLTILRHYEVKG